MKFMNTKTVPKSCDQNDDPKYYHTGLLVLKLKSGAQFPGYAHVCAGVVHSWVVKATSVDGKYTPDYAGTNYDISCLEGDKVVSWAYHPSVDEVVNTFA